MLGLDETSVGDMPVKGFTDYLKQQQRGFEDILADVERPHKTPPEPAASGKAASDTLSPGGRDVLGLLNCLRAIGETFPEEKLAYIGMKMGITDDDKKKLAHIQIAQYRDQFRGKPGASIADWLLDILEKAVS